MTGIVPLAGVFGFAFQPLACRPWATGVSPMQLPTRQTQKWADVRKPKENSSLVQGNHNTSSQLAYSCGETWVFAPIAEACSRKYLVSTGAAATVNPGKQHRLKTGYHPTVEQPPSIHPSIIKHVPSLVKTCKQCHVSVREKSRGDLPYHTSAHIHQAFPILEQHPRLLTCTCPVGAVASKILKRLPSS